jgi:hypothetical protein
MDFATVIKFLVPALQAILPMIPASTPAGKVAQVVLQLLPMLPRFGHPAAAGYRATLPVSLPPQSEWTPEGLLRHYGARPAVSDPDSPKPA